MPIPSFKWNRENNKLIINSAFDNYFLQAQRVRQLIKNDFNRVFRVPDFHLASAARTNPDGVDVLLHPSAIRTAPKLFPSSDSDGSSSLDSYVQDVLTVPASLAGLPALSVPVPVMEASISEIGDENSDGDGWPVGVSIVGQWGCDEVVLRVGEMIEGLNAKK